MAKSHMKFRKFRKETYLMYAISSSLWLQFVVSDILKFISNIALTAKHIT